MKRILLAAAITIAAVSSAHADTISGLYNTGIGNAGDQDSHYVLTYGNNTGSPYISDDSGFPINGYWFPNTSTSKWITPTVNKAQDFDPSSNGSYTYTLTFNLASGYNAATAALTGQMAADNAVTVSLNGHNLGSSSTYYNWTSFSANGADFVTGTNTLQFTVTNFAQASGNPTGLRVEFNSSSVVPEPESYAMLMAGLGAIGFIARRRKQV